MLNMKRKKEEEKNGDANNIKVCDMSCFSPVIFVYLYIRRKRIIMYNSYSYYI